MNHIVATTSLLFVLATGAFAQTSPTITQELGAGVHKAHIRPVPTGTLSVKQDHKAERKARLAALTPDERKAFKAEAKAKQAARLASMTPGQRQRYDARKAQRKAEHQKLK